MARRTVWTGVLALALTLVGSGAAQAQRAEMYELTENMRLIARGKAERRAATSQLKGFADIGTPLCPVVELAGLAARCTINMTGSDSVNTTTGRGPFWGSFTVVVEALDGSQNPFDGPELVLMTGRFRGQMDFSPALVSRIPFGTVSGVFTSRAGGRTPFDGTFRLPFLGSYAGPETGGMTLRQLFCPLSPDRNTLLDTPGPGCPGPGCAIVPGPDYAYIDTTASAPNGSCINVRPEDLSLGTATVRFDASF